MGENTWLIIGRKMTTLVTDVTVLAQGAATGDNAAIYQNGSNSSLTLINVTALAENAAATNYALYKYEGKEMVLRGGSYTARGGGQTRALYQYGADTWLEAWDITSLAENGNDNDSLLNFNAAVVLHGGSFTARGGVYARGIFNYQADLTAEGVTALSENGSDYSYGLYNGQYATATVSGGTFTARGGDTTFGIYNNSSDLTAEGVIALGEDGITSNNGLHNTMFATAVLNGGSFTGSSGGTASGVYNDSSASLEAHNITALGLYATSNYGLYNDFSATARLHGGSFTARGGVASSSTRGIYTHSDAASLEAENINVLGEGGSSTNRGLESSTGADVLITQSVLEGAGNSVVTTSGGGPVSLSNSRLIGGIAAGNVSCTAVSRGTTFNASGCP